VITARTSCSEEINVSRAGSATSGVPAKTNFNLHPLLRNCVRACFNDQVVPEPLTGSNFPHGLFAFLWSKTVNKNDSIKVVRLVLDTPSHEIRANQLDWLTIHIETSCNDTF
jgi:hypothetical protein